MLYCLSIFILFDHPLVIFITMTFVTWPPFCLSLLSTKGGQVTKLIILVRITSGQSNKMSIDKQ